MAVCGGERGWPRDDTTASLSDLDEQCLARVVGYLSNFPVIDLTTCCTELLDQLYRDRFLAKEHFRWLRIARQQEEDDRLEELERRRRSEWPWR